MLVKDKNSHTIPVFFHIPRCSGTYTISLMHELLRIYADCVYNPEKLDTIANVAIKTDEGKIAFRVLIHDPERIIFKSRIVKKNAIPTHYFLNIKDLDILKDLFVFSIVVEPFGFKTQKSFLEFFDKKTKKFIIIRTTISRAFSLYTYSKISKSKHEPVHKKFQNLTFEEYVTSSKFESNWLIKNILNLPNNTNITEKEYKDAVDFFSNFDVFDIKNSSTGIDNIFKKYRKVSTVDMNTNSHKRLEGFRNSSSPIEFVEEKLSEETRKVFSERSFWDTKLYKTLLNIKD